MEAPYIRREPSAEEMQVAGTGGMRKAEMHVGWFSTTCALNDESIQLFEDVFGTSLDMNRSILLEDFASHVSRRGFLTQELSEVKVKVCVYVFTCHSFFKYLHISFEKYFIFGAINMCSFKRHNAHAVLLPIEFTGVFFFQNRMVEVENLRRMCIPPPGKGQKVIREIQVGEIRRL